MWYCDHIAVYHIPTQPGRLVKWYCDWLLKGLQKTVSRHQHRHLYLICLWYLEKIPDYFEQDHVLNILQLFFTVVCLCGYWLFTWYIHFFMLLIMTMWSGWSRWSGWSFVKRIIGDDCLKTSIHTQTILLSMDDK